jgi:hypothetical protein
MSNNNIVLIVGKPSTGKSTSARCMDNPSGIVNLNCDMKRTPFKNKYALDIDINDPEELINGSNILAQCEGEDTVHTILLDTITYLMRSYKTMYIDEAHDGRAAWGNYQKYYNKLIHAIKTGNKNYVIMAHIADSYNDKEMVTESNVVLQGAVGRLGMEGDFTTIVEAVSKPVTKKLLDMQHDLFQITEREQLDGIKYMFVTRRVKEHPTTKARSASDLWKDEEVYIDNNIQFLVNRINDYYGE